MFGNADANWDAVVFLHIFQGGSQHVQASDPTGSVPQLHDGISGVADSEPVQVVRPPHSGWEASLPDSASEGRGRQG